MNTTTLNMTTLDGGVIIKKGNAPAPPSEESASTMEYWDCSAQSEIIGEVSLFFLQMKYSMQGAGYVASFVDYKDKRLTTPPTAISLDRSMLVNLEGTLQSVGEWLAAFGIDDFTQFGWVQITKEQFYSLD